MLPRVPGPANLQIYSVCELIKTFFRPFESRLDFASEIASAGELVQLPFPRKRVYFVTHPEDLKHILHENAANYKKSFDYGILAHLLRQGLVTTEGERWRKDRKVVQSVFREESYAALLPHMIRLTERTLQDWEEDPAFVIEAFSEMTDIALDVIGQKTFSADLSEDARTVRQDLVDCQIYLVERTQSAVDWAKWIPTPRRRQFERANARLAQVLEKRIAGRRANPPSGEAGLDLVGALDAAGMDEEGILAHVITTFIAGHETTANGLGWTLHLLARHPAWQERVAEECRAFLDSAEEKTPRAYRMGLPMLAATLEESYRLYPPIPVIGRECLAADTLAGCPIPAGSTVIAFLHGTHRRADLWERPTEFDPGRFMGERRNQIPPLAYLPFGYGPRFCVGASLATLESLVVLAHILARFRFAPTSLPMPVALPIVSLRPQGDPPLWIQRRPARKLEAHADLSAQGRHP